jgi:hypothetical protein
MNLLLVDSHKEGNGIGDDGTGKKDGSCGRLNKK